MSRTRPVSPSFHAHTQALARHERRRERAWGWRGGGKEMGAGEEREDSAVV